MDMIRIQSAIEKLTRRELHQLSGIVHSAQYKFAVIDMANHPAPIVGSYKRFDNIVDIIKRYHAETGLGLLESKHAVELAISICNEINIGW
jgi:hypothetical protein